MKMKLYIMLATTALVALWLSSCADTGFHRTEVSIKQRILEAPPWWDVSVGNPLDRPYDLKDAQTLHEENIEQITGFPYITRR